MFYLTVKSLSLLKTDLATYEMKDAASRSAKPGTMFFYFLFYHKMGYSTDPLYEK